ncbi:MAG: methyltransferase domain-containing protein [Candidatus Cybelea sp.]
MSTEPRQDKWAAWLERGRFGSDEATRALALERLGTVRDRVLQNASLSGQEVVLDVGTGEGLIGLGAMDLLSPPRGEVIFTDVSQPCLDLVARFLNKYSSNVPSSFRRIPADDLIGVADETVDVVTTRSVLIYVEDKRKAFREFFRVLRSKGRISLFEPINRDRLTLDEKYVDEYYGYSTAAIADLMRRIRVRDAAIGRSDNPMTDFSYLDLLGMCEDAGFFESHIEVQCDATKRKPRGWESFVNFAPNPNAETIGEELRQVFSPGELNTVVRHLRPLVESGNGIERSITAYIWAVKK